jgi:hypothetical protein
MSLTIPASIPTAKGDIQMLKNIQRANDRIKALMREIIAGENHLAQLEKTDDQYTPEYRLERCGRDWGMVEYVKTVYPGFEKWYTPGQRITCAAFVRCSLCGDIDTRWDDECPECLNCYDTGKVPQIDPHTRYRIELRASRYH